MKKYLIIDKNTMSRESISSLIYQIDKKSVVHEAECLNDVNSISDFYRSIDTVIYNSGDKKENQINNLGVLKSLFENSKILVITSSSEYNHIENLLISGATSVIPINSGRNEFVTAIHSTNIGHYYVSHNLLTPNKTNTKKKCTKDHETNVNSNTSQPSNKLTCRQKQVLDYIVKGYANKLIAYELGVSEGTIKLHVSSILRALKVTNRTEAAMISAGQFLNSHKHEVTLNH